MQSFLGRQNRWPKTAVREGDLILIARKDHILYDKSQAAHLFGLHGGPDPDEMLVP